MTKAEFKKELLAGNAVLTVVTHEEIEAVEKEFGIKKETLGAPFVRTGEDGKLGFFKDGALFGEYSLEAFEYFELD